MSIWGSYEIFLLASLYENLYQRKLPAIRYTGIIFIKLQQLLIDTNLITERATLQLELFRIQSMDSLLHYGPYVHTLMTAVLTIV